MKYEKYVAESAEMIHIVRQSRGLFTSEHMGHEMIKWIKGELALGRSVFLNCPEVVGPEPEINWEDVSNLDSILKLEAGGFCGVDDSISLSENLEYGMVWKELKPGDWLFIYKLSNGNYDRCRRKAEDFDRDFNWVPNWDSFLSSIGESEVVWTESPFPNKLFDLLDYFGTENVFGSTRSPPTCSMQARWGIGAGRPGTSYWEGFKIAEE